MAGGTSTWETMTEKFLSSCRAASATAAAFAGAVVSKPTAKKMTSRSGSRAAIITASRGEYTTLTSAPSALAESKLPPEPGTLNISPKEHRIVRGSRAKVMAASIMATGVTQTGQPGPWIRRIVSGSKLSNPYLMMLWVCPPQISIKVQGLRDCLARASAHLRTAIGSRNSSTYFMLALVQCRALLAHAPRFPPEVPVSA